MRISFAVCLFYVARIDVFNYERNRGNDKVHNSNVLFPRSILHCTPVRIFSVISVQLLLQSVLFSVIFTNKNGLLFVENPLSLLEKTPS